MIAVRPVRKEEVKPLVLAGKFVHGQSAYAHMDYDVGLLVRRGVNAVEHPEMFFAEAITHNDTPIGVLWGCLMPSFFGKDLVAMDLIFFLIPQMQGKCGEALKEIVANYHKWARERGAKLVNLGCSTQINPERTAALFEHLGYPKTGTLHATRLQ